MLQSREYRRSNNWCGNATEEETSSQTIFNNDHNQLEAYLWTDTI